MSCKFLIFLLASGLYAATINATTCSQADVTTAITAASTGDTVIVPAGSCSWGGLSVSKAITLQGAGSGSTLITLTSSISFTKQASGSIVVKGFGFSKTGGGNASKGIGVGGAWLNTEPVIFKNNSFTISDSGLFLVTMTGGVIWSNNSFTGTWDDSFLQLKDDQDSEGSWTKDDTIGTKDSTGKKNHYVEGNTFYGGTNQGIDADDAVRVVYRYNNLTYSSFNSHGRDTSPIGVRHVEVYNNNFYHSGGTDQIANQNWSVWIRGGTGVIYNNYFDDIAGGWWGNKPEIKFSIRGAEDVRPQGTCGNTSYPVPGQVGQGHNGTTTITDPMYVWGNTGTVGYGADWEWGNPCGFTFSTFFQYGRDVYNNGTQKPSYTAYTYPHPLAADATTASPTKSVCSAGIGKLLCR